VWFQANKETITKTLDAFKTDLERLGELISPENRKQFDAIIANVRKGSDRLDEVARQTEIALKEAGDLFRQMNGFIKALEEGASGITTAEDSKSLKLGRRVGSVARNLDEAMEKVNRMLGDVQNLVREAGSSDGTLRRLLQDPGLAQKIDELLAQALRQIPRLDRIIRDAETFADKIARHPELLGVGGAVRPGNGLKEPPARPMGTLPGFPPGDLRPMPVSP
jgi:phospholipid/cholesterol/gamma-HCH transport system substrate-binding protein